MEIFLRAELEDVVAANWLQRVYMESLKVF